MSQSNEAVATLPVPSRDVLTGILRDGAQRMLVQAINAEVDDWIGQHAELKNEHGHQLVVRNGHHPTRTLVTGVGPVEVSQPRVLDRRIAGQDENGQDVDDAGRTVSIVGRAVRSSMIFTKRPVTNEENAGARRATHAKLCGTKPSRIKSAPGFGASTMKGAYSPGLATRITTARSLTR